MTSQRRAVIDVGTNSVKVLVADVSGNEVQPVLERSKQTRLGKGFYKTHHLQLGPIAETAAAVAEFSRLSRAQGANSVRVFATSAARDAVNAAALTKAITAASSLPVEIISGEQEADWAFRGVTTNPGFAECALLLIDVGGGSTEFILGQGRELEFRESFPLGTIRMLEKLPHSDPPSAHDLSTSREWVKAFLQTQVLPRLEPLLTRAALKQGQTVDFVGTGGTSTILGRIEGQLPDFHRERIEAARIPIEHIRRHVSHLWNMTLEERKSVVGLPANRADVILFGVLIYEAIMRELGFSELRISTRGLRFAAIMD